MRTDPPGTHSLLQTQLGLPPSSGLCRLLSRKEDLQQGVKPGQKSCVRSSGIITLLAHTDLVMVRDEAASDEATMINLVGVTNVARQC